MPELSEFDIGPIDPQKLYFVRKATLAKLVKALRTMRAIQSGSVHVQEDFEVGTTLSVDVAPPPPVIGCPVVPTLTAEVSGIIIDCPPSPANGFHTVIGDISGTYTITSGAVSFLGTTTVNYDGTDCPVLISEDCAIVSPDTFEATIIFIDPATFLPLGQLFFGSASATNPSILPNDPFIVCSGGYFGHAGQVKLSW